MRLKKQLPAVVGKKMNEVLIEHFFTFFTSTHFQQEFLLSLSNDEIGLFVKKLNGSERRQKKSLIYEITSKDKLVQKYESKVNFAELFPTDSTFALPPSQANSVGRLLISGDTDSKEKKEDRQLKDNKDFLKFLQTSLTNHSNGKKLFEYVFLEAFKLLTAKVSFKQLETLFFDTFSLLEKVISQSSPSAAKGLNDSLLLVLQLYFASICSLSPNKPIVEVLIRIVESLQKKDFIKLLELVEEPEYEGISQTSERIY